LPARSMPLSAVPQWAPRELWSPGFPYPQHACPPKFGMTVSYHNCPAISGSMCVTPTRPTVESTRTTQMSQPSSSSAARTPSVLPSRTYP
ncbi:hypothetical protein BGW38_010405, partial [Lunasporangiospora selenospora]